jgi:hypothetical protein
MLVTVWIMVGCEALMVAVIILRAVAAEHPAIRRMTRDHGRHARPVPHNRLRIHLTCISTGAVVGVAVTWTNFPLAHVAVIFPTVPSALQEICDRIYNL